MDWTVKEYKNCRLCLEGELVEVYDFGLTHLANEFVDLSESFTDTRKSYPLVLCKCDKCDSWQLRHAVNPEILFSNYLYESSSSPQLVEHFKSYAKDCISHVKLDSNSLVYEVGGNDGVLAKEFKDLGVNCINIEPATNIAEISRNKGIETINSFLDKDVAENAVLKYGKADLVTCNNCFAHCPNLNEIIESVKILLKDDGYFVFENAYWVTSLSIGDIFQIYHEHQFVHHIKPISTFLHKHGFVICDIGYNNIQNGSYRIIAKKGSNTYHEPFFGSENSFDLKHEFYKAVELHKKNSKILNQILENGSGWNIYGCPAKLALLLKFYFGDNVNKYFNNAFDNSSLKYGKFIPNSYIRIYPANNYKDSGSKFTLIGAYNFADSIIKKLENEKAVFVNVIPKLYFHVTKAARRNVRTSKLTHDHRTNDSRFTRKLRRGGH